MNKDKQTERQDLFSAKFYGKTITAVEAQAINCISFRFQDGSVVVLEAEAGPLGIPVISFDG